MSIPIFRRDGIAIYVRDQSGSCRYVLNKWQKFDLEQQGIYTLEGANQSGKSVLIKLMMGVLPPRVGADEEGGRTIVGDRIVSIRHVADALQTGLVAVFQDDELIPSMTVREQVLMRHASPTWRNYLSLAGEILRDWIHIDWLTRYLRGVEGKGEFPLHHGAYPAQEVMERARKILDLYPRQFRDIMDKYPRQLSGGAKAVARLLQAQASRSCKVLFLDEAFAGVQADVWPRLVEVLKAWAQAVGGTLVVVSHNQRELIQWQPIKRFLINDGEVVEKGVKGYVSLQPGMPRRYDAFPIFEPPLETPWFHPFDGPFLVLVDKNVVSNPQMTLISDFLSRAAKGRIQIQPVELTEADKTWDLYERLELECLESFPTPRGAIVVVGGGAMLNLGGLVAATLHRGALPFVLIPTTVMAIADVIVGSKTGVNVIRPGGSIPLKHVVGVYANPAAVVVDRRLLDSLPQLERKRGLSECLKHGLLQDEKLFEKTLALLGATDVSVDDCYDLALTTMELKRRVLTFDPFEKNVGRILLYGHLHAHSLERASNFSISHGEAVFAGIILDLFLAGSTALAETILTALAGSPGLLPDVSPLDGGRIESAYQLDTYRPGPGFEIISVEQIAEYALPIEGGLHVIEVTWLQILNALSFLQAKAPRKVAIGP